MQVDKWLKRAANNLKLNNIGTARLDCLVLLEDEIGKDRAWLLAHPEFELNEKQVKKLNEQIKERAKHTPLAFIRGRTEFYGQEFIITKDVLEPRPESETMIDLLLNLAESNKHKIIRIADIGTGSGALAITAKLEIPEADISAIDIDPKCLKVARQNAKKLNVEVSFFEGSLLQPLSSTFDVLLCNLPYVPDSHTINPAAMWEPKHAIFGGTDGLDLYRELFAQISNRSGKPNYVLTESLPTQHKELEKIAAEAGYKQQTEEEFIQLYIFNQDIE